MPGVGAVEVSLVLDLSGSMYYLIKDSNPPVRRIDKLRTGAENFVILRVPQEPNLMA